MSTQKIVQAEPDLLPVDSTPNAPSLGRLTDEKPSFWDHLAQLDEARWTHHMVYLYRLEPKIDKSGENAFISKYQRAIDQADILNDHGSGRYLAMLNDTRARRTANKATFTVHNDAFPPRVILSQLTATPENDKWLDWLRRLDRNDKPTTTAATMPEGNSMAQLTAIIERVVDKGNATDATVQSMLMDAHRHAIEMVASQGKGNTDLNALMDALTKAKALMTPAAPQTDPLGSLNSVLALIDRLKPATDKDPLESVTRTLDLLERIRRTAGAEPAAETGGWEKAIGLAGGLLAPVLAPIGQAIAMKMSGAVRMPMMPAAPPVPAPIAVDSMSGHAMPAAPVMPVQGNPTDAPAGTRQLTEAELAHIQELLIANAATMQRFFDGGRSGTDYADYFIEGHGVPDWQSLRDFGFQNLIALIQQFPPAWNNIAPRLSQFERFMSEFYAWTPEDANEDTHEGEADNGKAA